MYSSLARRRDRSRDRRLKDRSDIVSFRSPDFASKTSWSSRAAETGVTRSNFDSIHGIRNTQIYSR